jgi:hypothetical protein
MCSLYPPVVVITTDNSNINIIRGLGILISIEY